MQLPQIRLQSNFIRTGLQIDKPIQEIDQPHAEQSIQQPHAVLEIETVPGKLTIDQTKAREDMDLKSIGRRIEEFAQNGYQDWLKGLERRAAQGNELMKIENGGNPLATQAKENSEKPMIPFNIGWIPSHFSVKTKYEPAKVNINVKPQKPIIDAEIRKPIHEYTPGKTSIEVLEKNRLVIDFINLFPENNE
ncbi:hypothetical protein ELQ35_03470 [Peribacillus cavernae]|uniref:YviE n=1 Tax=Peribacillus cavernae TaxID=1674310 RepID=A0A433HSX5_9BACI|nr:DUF6470 family protein [Peribacillus cavernae]MDQ0218418.1 lipoprotein-anchoring transpeptidase ErfK/SrfK [Peribacillus cavernae]RUQ31420.1 hypothetical protein ELQ35_03470 [Peribacillus cavernae]